MPVWHALPLPYGPGIAFELQGQNVWLASPDVTLEPTPEAALCLLAPWCAQEHISLSLPGPRPSALFLANVQSATALMGSWWKHPAIRFLTPGALTLPPSTAPIVHGKKALFFSGGVDAFYSLTQNPDVSVLVFIVGFDNSLANQEAWEAKIRSHREIAQARGLRLITVFTNLREHPALGTLDFFHYHGAVLAAVAHSLRSQAAHWIISASWWPGYLLPWGTHPDLDWRWGDESTSFSHFGIDKWRGEKLAAMADDQTVHDHLQVCFAPTGSGNCGKCEKCVRTRLAYHCEVPGRRCTYIPDSPPLPEAIDSLKPLHSIFSVAMNYEHCRDLLPTGDPIAAAIERLLVRSRPPSRWSRMKTWVVRHLRRRPKPRRSR